MLPKTYLKTNLKLVAFDFYNWQNGKSKHIYSLHSAYRQTNTLYAIANSNRKKIEKKANISKNLKVGFSVFARII